MKTTDIELKLVELEDEAETRWDRFVEEHPEGTFFHRAGWRRVIRKVFGYQNHFVYAEKAGAIVGVLPLIQIGKGLFGHRLVSTPFCVHGGPLVVCDEAREALDAHAMELADRLGVDWLEFRESRRIREDWEVRDDVYYNFRRAITASPEENLKLIPRKQRAVVRRALKDGLLTDEVDHDADRFYRVYSVSVRNLGSPVFSKRYPQELKREFGDDCDFLIVLSPDGVPVASVISFYFRDEVLPYYGGGMPAARGCGGHAYLYYRLMCRAAERGARVFDFGRSKRDTGAYSFKKNFGFEPQALVYEYRAKAGRTIPDATTLNPRYQKFIDIWKRLPLPIANLIGPYLVKRLG